MADTPLMLESLTNLPFGKTGIKDLPELQEEYPDWSENDEEDDVEDD